MFTYDGTVEEAATSLRQTLLPSGFSVESENTSEDGASYTFEKTLSDDEKFETTAFYEGFTGTSTGTQGGRLVFILTDEGDGPVTVKMTSRLVATMQQAENEFKSSSEKTEMQTTRGHPLPMKYGQALVEEEGWTLNSPPRAEVFVNANRQTSSSGQQSSSNSREGSAQGLSSTAPPFGVGVQYAAPAYGISGMYDFTDKISGQAVLGFFGRLQSYSGRILYRFNQKEAYDLYGYGTIGVWRYSGVLTSESVTGLGGGVGLEYSWQHLFDSSKVPPLFGNIEIGFVTLGGDFSTYNFSSFAFGIGIHYRFGN